ncbi:MAG: hypothetical protein HYX57_08630 [Chloroflexi bacterium]|nr:hypothetical protein [Chloroflexota bacterium]
MLDTSHAGDAIVRRAIDELSAGGRGLCGTILATDVRWHEPGRSLVAGDYQGCDEVEGSLFTRLRELSDGTFAVVAWEGVSVDGGRAVAMYVVRATRAGRDLLSRDVCIVEIRDGAIAEAQVYHADQHAWDRFWS